MYKKSIQQTRRLFTLVLALGILLTSLPVHAQNVVVTIDMQDVPMEAVMNEIEKQTKYLFLSNQDVDIKRKVSVHVQSGPLNDALSQMVRGTDVVYQLRGSNIMLSRRQAGDQQKTVTGVIRDAQGNAATGVSVVMKGTTVGTISDAGGAFSLQLPGDADNAILVFSFLGHATQEVPLGDRTQFNISLREEGIEMDQVVVTALGIKRSEKALSYNVQRVGSDELTTVKDANFVNALAGKVAGVNINSSSSGTGGAAKVVMRGSRSISSSSNALYVIDGVPMYNGTRDGSSSLSDSPMASTGTTDMAADINPEDIESISVLTGAAAAALYGSSASNGAIVINTRKGTEGATTLTITQNTDLATAFVTPEFQNRYGTSMDASQRNRSWGNRLNDYNYMGYDPVSDYFQTGVTTTETVAFSTGTSRNQTYVSAAALNSEGIIPNNIYDRYNFTFRNTAKLLKDKMTLDLGGSYIRQRDLNMTNQGSYSNPLASAYLYPRGNDWGQVEMFERYDVQRKIALPFWDMDAGEYVLQNPYWINYRNLRENNKDRYMLNASVNYKVLDWLTLSARINMDNAQDKGTQKYYAGTNTQLTESSKNGLYGESGLVSKQVYADFLATIEKTICRDWSINATLGTSLQDNRADGRNVYGPIRDGSVEGETALPPNVFNLLQLSSTKSKRELTGWHEQTQSVFVSAEVGFKRAYYLTATLRTDWASQLAGPESVQSSFSYPSVGMSFILSEIFKMPRQISYLKLRGSYANVGLAFQRFLANPTLKWDNAHTQWDPYTSMPVSNLKPEYTHSFEAGLEARFLKHFNLNVTLYNTNTINQLFNPQISPSSMYSSMYVQNGNVRNRGIEASVGYRNTWRKFSWDTNFALSANRNKVIKLAGEVYNVDSGESTAYSFLSLGGLGNSIKFLIREGGTLGDMYTSLDLVRDSDGKIYVDENGHIALDSSNKPSDQWKKLGSIFPKANLSWRNDFAWGNMNFGFLVSARLGGVVYSRTQASLDYHGVSERSALARDNGGVMINGGERISAYDWYSVVANSDGLPQYYTYDATNVRLQEASIGYSIPKKWLGNVCDVTISAVGRNLFMFYKKAPFDPESTATVSDNYYQGIDYFMMPSLRNIGFSVRVKF